MKATLLVIMLASAVAACGDDPPPAPPPPQPGAAQPAAAKPGTPGSKAALLQPRQHIEERVDCSASAPDKPTGPACKPDAPVCDAGKWCVAVGGGFSCEACPERESIRHEFKDRDFVADQTRDPFQSFIIVQNGLEEPVEKREDLGSCRRADQLVATNYSYLDMKLVGIVAQGTQRKVLMMDRGNLGHIVHRGDCVGKEKALVKDIGPGFVTFVVQPDENDKTPNRAPSEQSIQLNPTGLQVAPQPTAVNDPTSPVVAPKSSPGPAAPVVTP